MAERDKGTRQTEAWVQSLYEELIEQEPEAPSARTAREISVPASVPLDEASASGVSGPEPPDHSSSLGAVVAAIDAQMDQIEQPPVVAPREDPSKRGERHIVFSLAGGRYCVAVGSVIEVGDIPAYTPVPNVPEWVLGVSNLRGEVLAVLDSRRLLGFEPVGRLNMGRLLVVQASQQEISAALVVDGVHGITRLRVADLVPPTAPIADRLAPFLMGVRQDGEHLLAVLDMEKLLLSPGVRQLELG